MQSDSRTFDRAEHCRRIGAHGGATTAARYGSHHMRTIGKAGAQATIRKHGLPFFKGVTKAKGWTGPRRRDDLAIDLMLGRYLAELA